MWVKICRNFYEGNICWLKFFGYHQHINRALKPYNHFFHARSGCLWIKLPFGANISSKGGTRSRWWRWPPLYPTNHLILTGVLAIITRNPSTPFKLSLTSLSNWVKTTIWDFQICHGDIHYYERLHPNRSRGFTWPFTRTVTDPCQPMIRIPH